MWPCKSILESHRSQFSLLIPSILSLSLSISSRQIIFAIASSCLSRARNCEFHTPLGPANWLGGCEKMCLAFGVKWAWGCCLMGGRLKGRSPAAAAAATTTSAIWLPEQEDDIGGRSARPPTGRAVANRRQPVCLSLSLSLSRPLVGLRRAPA